MSPSKRSSGATKSKRVLTPEQLARAVSANPLYANRLGWMRYTDAIAILAGAPPVPASPTFAQAVAGWQLARRLDVDGIVGPITWGEIKRALTPSDSPVTILPSDTPSTPDGFDAIIAAFGDPRPLLTDGALTPENEIIWQRQTLALGHFPFPIRLDPNNPAAGAARTFQAHRRLVSVFEAVFEELARVGLTNAIHSYQGIYAFRPIRGIASRLSLHAFGAAIDLNAETNQLGQDGDMNPDVVNVFRHFGFRWGGDFAGRKDSMHFQYATGY